MFKNYLKIAFRNLVKYKKFTLINIFGLAIGLASFVLIMLWVQDELSFDRFHKNSNNIYLTLRESHGNTSAATSMLLAQAIKDELPEVIDATSTIELPGSVKAYLSYNNKGFEESFTLIDNNFFNIFSFPFKRGDQKNAATDPNSIVLTERMKQKYFGNNDALGKSLELKILGQKRSIQVTGILENIPRNSSMQHEIFIPISFFESFGVSWESWDDQSMHTYLLSEANADMSGLGAKISKCRARQTSDNNNETYSLLPLTKTYLHSKNIEYFNSNGDIKYIYMFSLIAGIILLIACINYANLANALSLKRTKEIGIKKVVGAGRKELIFQYIGETILLTLIAMLAGLLLCEFTLPTLNQVTNKSLTISWYDPQFLVLIGLTILGTSLISGLYPSFFISGFQPIHLFKGQFKIGRFNLNTRKFSIVFQFALSIIVIVCTAIILNQLHFIQNKNLGFDKENIVCVSVKGNIHDKFQVFKNEILKNSNISGMSRSEQLDTNSMTRTSDVKYSGQTKDHPIPFYIFRCDENFSSVYNLQFVDGRFMSDQFSTDKTDAYVLNETAVKKMELNMPIGKQIQLWGKEGTIIGVTKDFHYGSFHKKIEPLIMTYPSIEEIALSYREISFRIKANTGRESLAFIEKTWKSFFPSEPFNYHFFDDALNANYIAEQRMATLFKYSSILAIFIACLGLYGLTVFTIEQKIKDIGVYKVLGANISNIVYLLSKNYMLWILSANFIAWPITYYVMNKWLQNFAYRIELTVWPFLLSGLITLAIALITVSWQAVKAALANPVKSLQYE